MDIYFLDVKRLALNANVASDELLKQAFINGLRSQVVSAVLATPNVDSLRVEQIVDLARVLMSVESNTACIATPDVKMGTATCYTCGMKGHYASSCRKRGDKQQGRRCYVCDQTGHVANACWRRKSSDVKESNTEPKN